MKKLIAMYLGIMIVREVAKYYKINSFEDLVKMVLPQVEELFPKTGGSNSTSNSTNKSKSLTHA